MSNTGRMFTEDALTRTLDRWLADGPREMPAASVEASLRTVAVTGQRRWRGRLHLFSGSSPLAPAALTVAAITAIVAIGFGLGQVLPPPGHQATPTPAITDEPSPDGSELPQGMVLYTDEEVGYQIVIPASWTPAEFITDPPGATRFGDAFSSSGPSAFGALTIAIGNPDGTIYDCAPGACRLISATTIAELDDAVNSKDPGALAAGDRITEIDEDLMLDGEPARLERVRFTGGLLWAGTQFHHVFAFHDGRPVILSFDKYAYGLGQRSNSVAWVQRLVESFHFLDRDMSQMNRVTDAAAGFEFSVPESWQEVDAGVPGVRHWTSTGVDFFISLGESVIDGGRLAICDPTVPDVPDCDSEVRVPFSIPYRPEYSLDYLTTYGLPCFSDRPCTEASDLMLGGELARETREPAGDVERTWITAMHDLKPAVLYWSEPLDAQNVATIERMRASFRFLSTSSPPSEDPTGLRTFSSQRDGFEILVPGVWVDAQAALIGRDEYPGVTPFGAGNSSQYRTNITAMTVSIGDESGRIWTCGISDCEARTATTQDDLLAVAMATVHAAGGVRGSDIFIGGVRGGELHPAGFELGAYRVAYGFVNGRPVVIAVDDNFVQMDALAPYMVTQMFRSFRFTED